LMDCPVLLKVLASLGCILLLNRAIKQLFWAVAAGAVLLGLWLGHSPQQIGAIAWERFASLDNALLLCVVMQVVWLSTQMAKTGVMRDLVVAVQARISRRSAMAVLPAVIGGLPMPAGAVFSAPMVDKCDENGDLHPLHKAQVNYWFRHIWEYWWPLYPGVLVAMEITGLEVWQFALLQFPLSLVHVGAGILFLLRRIDNSGDAEQAAGPKPPLLGLVAPILVVILTYAVLRVVFPGLSRLSKYLPMAVGILFASLFLQRSRPLPWRDWKTILPAKRTFVLALLVAVIRVYGAFIEHDLPDGTPLVDLMRQELAQWGIPVVAMMMLIPFASGVTTGIAVGFVGASMPIAVSLLGPSPSSIELMATTVLAYACGYMGLMLSPVHLCLVVTSEHFQTRMSHALKDLLRPAILVVLGAIAYYVVLKAFGGN